MNTVYGQKGILTDEEIKYMELIVNSGIDDFYKALELYSFCNYAVLLKSYNYYRSINHALYIRLDHLKNLYNKFDKKGYYDSLKKQYNVNIELIGKKLLQLVEVFESFKSNEIEYIKVKKMLSICNTSKELENIYSLFLKYGKDDTRLIFAKEALDNFDFILKEYRRYENGEIYDKINYVSQNIDYFEGYKYSKFVIESFIDFDAQNNSISFLESLGIDDKIFEFCISCVEELDVDLYNKYILKKANNSFLEIKNKIRIMNDIAYGIKNGVLPNGKLFDLIEFIKMVPFKYNKDFTESIKNFIINNNYENYYIIMKYIYNNKVDEVLTKRVNISNTCKSTKHLQIDSADLDAIINYLNYYNIPINKKTISVARSRYLKGELTIEESSEKVQKQMILIP